MERMKEFLLSDKGMKIVNFLFLIALLIRNTGFILIAYFVWLIYLILCIRNTGSKAKKIINTAFIVFAILMIMVNLIYLKL